MSGSNRDDKPETGLKRFVAWVKSKATVIVVSIAVLIASGSIIWGIFYGLSQEVAYEQSAGQGHADYSKYTGREKGQACNGLVSIKKLQCERETRTEKDKQDNADRRDYADLVAQRSSALWAKIMGIAALIGMGLSLIGVALVWITFRETRLGASAADKTYQAFIKVEDASLVFRVIRANDYVIGEKTCASINYSLSNVGRSAAFIASIENEYDGQSHQWGSALIPGQSVEGPIPRFTAPRGDVSETSTVKIIYATPLAPNGEATFTLFYSKAYNGEYFLAARPEIKETT